MRRLASALALLLGLAASASAAEGTTGAEFLKLGVSARGLAMGGAATAVADDATAAYWNPAGLAYSGGGRLAASFSTLFKDQKQGYLALSGPSGGAHLALSADYMWIDDIEKRAADSETAEDTFKASDLAIALSWARAFGGTAVGLTVKHIRTSLDAYKESTQAVDAGVRFGGPGAPFSLGATVQNLGPKLGPDKLPRLAKAGVAFRLGSSLLLAADVERWLETKRSSLDLGGELAIGSLLKLRGGWQSARKDDELGGNAGLSGGLGLDFGGLNVDYAYLPFGDLGNTHRVTLGLRF